MSYGRRWQKRFGLSAAVWALFNTYFFFFIQDRKLGYLVYLNALFLAAFACLTAADYGKFAKDRREKEQMMGQGELICRSSFCFENKDMAEHDVRVLEKQMDRMFEENCSLQDFVARWCHELKIPLAAGLLIDEKIGDREVKTAMREQLEKMNQQVNSLLLGCRLQSSLMDIQVKRTLLGDCVKISLRNNRFFLIQKGFELKVETDDAAVYTDPSWMVYVLDQLLGNAVKYARTFGEKDPEGTKRLSIWTGREHNRVRLFVEDNGEGILDRDIRRIFEKGYTGSNYHNGRQKSTGMGLYMVSRIIDRLGHKICVESEYGKYTRFCITFFENSYYLRNHESV